MISVDREVPRTFGDDGGKISKHYKILVHVEFPEGKELFLVGVSGTPFDQDSVLLFRGRAGAMMECIEAFRCELNGKLTKVEDVHGVGEFITITTNEKALTTRGRGVRLADPVIARVLVSACLREMAYRAACVRAGLPSIGRPDAGGELPVAWIGKDYAATLPESGPREPMEDTTHDLVCNRQ